MRIILYFYFLSYATHFFFLFVSIGTAETIKRVSVLAAPRPSLRLCITLTSADMCKNRHILSCKQKIYQKHRCTDGANRRCEPSVRTVGAVAVHRRCTDGSYFFSNSAPVHRRCTVRCGSGAASPRLKHQKKTIKYQNLRQKVLL